MVAAREFDVQEQPSRIPILRLDAVCQITTLRKTLIYHLIKEDTFPKPRQPGVAWRENEVQAWMISQVEANSERLRK